MTVVAVLDSLNRFVGIEDVPDEEVRGRIVIPATIDLPDDGSYRWDSPTQAFVSVEQAAASQAQMPPIPFEHMVHLVVRALIDGTPFPDEVRQSADWYDKHLRARAEVRARPTKRLLRG